MLVCSLSLPQQVVCLSVDGLRRSFGVAMTISANWWVEYSGHSKHHGTAVSIFSFADRHIFGIVPITEVLHSYKYLKTHKWNPIILIVCFLIIYPQSNTIINTAILTNQPVSLPVTVLAISHDEKVSDVTSAVMCHSANENTVKVQNSHQLRSSY